MSRTKNRTSSVPAPSPQLAPPPPPAGETLQIAVDRFLARQRGRAAAAHAANARHMIGHFGADFRIARLEGVTGWHLGVDYTELPVPEEIRRGTRWNTLQDVLLCASDRGTFNGAIATCVCGWSKVSTSEVEADSDLESHIDDLQQCPLMKRDSRWWRVSCPCGWQQGCQDRKRSVAANRAHKCPIWRFTFGDVVSRPFATKEECEAARDRYIAEEQDSLSAKFKDLRERGRHLSEEQRQWNRVADAAIADIARMRASS